jgi:nicotinate-nucleotide pyrophosphorylase
VKQLLEGLNFKIKDNHVKVYVDNKGAISLAENAVYSPRTKHVDLKYHISRQAVARGDIQIEYVNTDNMVADCLTKAIGG